MTKQIDSMKNIEQVENLSLHHLFNIASDESIAVPEDLTLRISTAVEREKRKNSVFTRRIVGLAASVAIIIGAGVVGFSAINSPKDTFDSPEEAYAYLEQAFGKISYSAHKGNELINRIK